LPPNGIGATIEGMSGRPNHAPNVIDIQVGERLRSRRKQLGMTQSHLAGALGVTFQQVQKYERGANRVSASTLYEMAAALGVDIAYFFEELRPLQRAADVEDDPMRAFVLSHEGPELAQHFKVLGPKERRAILDVARAMAEAARA
jgi:transcriptional regulator with XRE-family HTH domain